MYNKLKTSWQLLDLFFAVQVLVSVSKQYIWENSLTAWVIDKITIELMIGCENCMHKHLLKQYHIMGHNFPQERLRNTYR